jgi:hypothetical protein
MVDRKAFWLKPTEEEKLKQVEQFRKDLAGLPPKDQVRIALNEWLREQFKEVMLLGIGVTAISFITKFLASGVNASKATVLDNFSFKCNENVGEAI